MKTRLLSVALVLAVLAIISPVFGAVTTVNFANTSGDSLWTNAANWTLNGIPDITNVGTYTDPWAQIQSDISATVDTHVAETTFRTRVGNNNSAGSLTIISGASLTNSDQLVIGQAGNAAAGKTSYFYVEGDYIQTAGQVRAGATTDNATDTDGGYHHGTIIVDGGSITATNGGSVLQVGNYDIANDGVTTNIAVGVVELKNGASLAIDKIEINGNANVGYPLTDSRIIVNDSTLYSVNGGEIESQLGGRFDATNSSIKLSEVEVTRNAQGFSVIGGATHDDLQLPVLRISADGVISNVTLTDFYRLQVADASDSTSTLDLDFKNAVTNRTVDADAGNLWIGTGANSAGTLNFTGGNIHLQTSSVSIATGAGSTGTLNLNGGTITGVIGDFALGSGAAGDATNLFGSLDSYGTLRTDVDMVVTSGNHVVTALNVAQGDNSSASILLNTNMLASGAAITIAAGSNSSGSMDTESGFLVLETNNLSLAMGLGATMTSDVIFQGVAGNFSIGAGADTSTKDAINHIETIGDINLNTMGLQITSGVHKIVNMRIADTSYVTSAYTNDGAALDLTIENNLLISDNTRATGTFYMASGSLNVSNTISIANAGGGEGAFIMTGGAVTANVVQVGSAGKAGTDQAHGLLHMTGGSITSRNDLVVGGEANSNFRSGDLFIGGGASIDVNDDIFVGGYSGNTRSGNRGEIIVSNGTIIAGDDVFIGRDSDSTGRLSIVHAAGLFANTGNPGNATPDMTIGNASNGYGFVTVDAGTLAVGRTLYLGAGQSTANGTLTINGGSVEVGVNSAIGDLILANLSNTVGRVEMTGGTLNVVRNIIVGQGGGSETTAGGFGTFTATGAAITNLGSMNVANNNYTKGYVGITNSSLRIMGAIVTADALGSDGEVHIIGGTFTSTNPANLNIGTGVSSKGLLEIAANQADIGAITVNVGTASNAMGTLILNNVGITNTGFLNVGQNAGTGVATLTNGTVFYMTGTAAANQHARIGINAGGTGTLNIDGSTLDMTATSFDVQLGLNASSTGTVNMANGAVLKTDIVQLGVGNGALGTLNVTDSTVTATQLYVGNSVGGEGVATISGVSTVNVEIVKVANQSNEAKGTLNIEGGTINVGTTAAGDGHFSIGNASNTTAVVNMSGGTLNMQDTSGTANLRVGIGGAGTFNLSSGQVNATNQQVNIGQNNGGNGTLNISGDGIFNTGGVNLMLGVGSNSVGNVNVFGGQLIANRVDLGNNADGIGYFTVTGGVVNVANAFNVGTVGTGTLTMDGGTLSVGDLVIGSGSSTGTVFLLDGLLQITQTTSLVISNGSSLYMEKGILSWNDSGGTQLGLLEDMIGAGLITGSNGFAEGGGVVLDSTNFTALGNGFFFATGLAGGDATAFVTVIPEPATIGMMMGIGGGLLWIRRRLYIG